MREAEVRLLFCLIPVVLENGKSEIGTERGIGKWRVKGKGQQWAGGSCSIEVSIAATGRFGGIKLKRRTKEGYASRGERRML